MDKVKIFIRTTVLGGLVVLLPVGILLIAFRWIFNLIRGVIAPLTEMVMDRSEMRELVAIGLVLGIIVITCFLIGLLVRTQIGRFLHEVIETRILRVAPGYSLVKEIVLQFLGNRPTPFGAVAMVRPFGNDVMAMAFVTEQHDNGWYAVFIPTGPNPTSGNILHLPPELVEVVPHPVEDTMRAIISCGAGSAKLMATLQAQRSAATQRVAED